MVNEFERRLLQDRYDQSETSENEDDEQNRAKDWHLLYPEAFPKENTPESINDTVSSDSRSIHQSTLANSPFSMHNPPTQVMERDEVYDSQRIPDSVFARKESVNPSDWSVSSNDSLFSLQVGSSMRREQALLLSGELERLAQCSKSGDLSTPELTELETLAGLTKSDEIFTPSPLHSDTPQVEVQGEIPEAKNLEEQKGNLVIENKKERHQHQSSSIHSSNVSRPSDVSEDSTYSFAFPVLGQGEKNVGNFGVSRQRQSEAEVEGRSSVSTAESEVEARNSLATSEPVKRGKNWCFGCCSCCHFLSCCPFFSGNRCCSCSDCFPTKFFGSHCSCLSGCFKCC